MSEATDQKTVREAAPAICRHCAHYFITWDLRAPYGCKALGFKSRKRPSAVVLESSGIRCQMYRPK